MSSSIPLPALAVQPPPQQESPINQYAKLVQLKSLLGQQQLQQGQAQIQQQQLQQEQQKNQMGAMQLQDMQTLRSLSPQFVKKDDSGNITGYDSEGLFNAAAKAGVNPQTLSTLQNNLLDTKAKLATLSKEQIDQQNTLNKGLYERVESLKGISDPAQRQQAYQQNLQWAAQNGVDIRQFPTQVPDNQALTSMEASLGMHAQALSDAESEQKAATEKAQEEASKATTEKTQLESQALKQFGGMTPQMIEARYLKVQQDKNLGKPVSAEDQAFAKAYEKNKLMAPAFNFSMQAQGVSGAPLNPAQQSTAQAILEGRMTPPSSFALRTPYWQTVMGAVFQQDPQFSEQRAQLRKDYTVGPQSKEINAINTAMGHVGLLGDAIDALNNNNVNALNKIANAVGVQIGKDNVTTFNTIVHRVGPEIAKAYVGAGGSAEERGADEKDFDPKLGPQQLRSNVAITARLLRSKIAGLANQWNQNKSDAMPSFEDRFIMPEAKQELDKWAPQGQAEGSPIQSTKTLSMATIQRAAKDHGISVDEAKKQALAAGYTVK